MSWQHDSHTVTYLPQHDVYCLDVTQYIISLLLDGLSKVLDPLSAVNFHDEPFSKRISDNPAFKVEGHVDQQSCLAAQLQPQLRV